MEINNDKQIRTNIDPQVSSELKSENIKTDAAIKMFEKALGQKIDVNPSTLLEKLQNHDAFRLDKKMDLASSFQNIDSQDLKNSIKTVTDELSAKSDLQLLQTKNPLSGEKNNAANLNAGSFAIEQNVQDLAPNQLSSSENDNIPEKQLSSKVNASDQHSIKVKNDDVPANELSSIFSSIMAGKVPDPNSAGFIANEVNETAPTTESDVQEIFKLADKIVDRILVSDPKTSGSTQVTISMNNSSVLPGTEISLRRDLDGLLSVVVSTNNQQSFNKIVSVRDRIVDGVQKYEKQNVRFIIENEDASDLS